MEEQNEEQAQIQIEDLSGAKKVITFEIPAKVVTRELDNAFRELKKTARVKGFRPGKIPRSVLEKMFGKNVRDNIKKELIGEAFEKAMLDHKLEVIGEPSGDFPEQLISGEPYKFKMTVDIKPKVENIDFKGLKLTKNNYTISDDMVDHQLKIHQQTMPSTEPIMEDRSIQKDDIAVIEYEGLKNGAPLEILPRTSAVRLEIGKNELFPNFDDHLVGMNKNQERQFEFTFPADYTNTDLANQTIEMKVLLKDIRKKVYPELNDDFAKKLGNYSTMDEVKAEIRSNLETLYENQSEQELQEEIFVRLLERTTFDVPDTWINHELGSIKLELQQSMAAQNIDMEKTGFTDEMIRKQYYNTAVAQARRHLLLNYLIEQEKLVATDAEIEAEFERMSTMTGKAIQTIKDHYAQEENQQELDKLKYLLLERNAMKMVIDANKVENVTLEANIPTNSDQANSQSE